jgi:hypothetical protein
MLMLRNNIVYGCETEEQIVTLCQDCTIIDMTKCPAYIPGSLLDITEKIVEPVPMQFETDYEQVASEIANLVIEKQLQYGNSFQLSYDVMKVLYPNGMNVDQMKDALVIIRILDKLFRIASGNLGSEDAFSDIVGYGLLAVVRNKRDQKL